jgi:hypothetical protein
MSQPQLPSSTSEEVMGSLARVLYERQGREVIPLITSLFGKLGSSAGARLKRKGGTQDFTTAVTTFFTPALQSKPPRAEFVDLTENSLIVKAFTCRIGLCGAGRELCEAVMELDREMINQITGEEVNMIIEKSLAAGDDCCLIKFSVIG